VNNGTLFKIYLLPWLLLPFNLAVAQNALKEDSSQVIYLEKVNSIDELFGKFKGSVVSLP
jgi:hypothetical protein